MTPLAAVAVKTSEIINVFLTVCDVEYVSKNSLSLAIVIVFYDLSFVNCPNRTKSEDF